MWELWRSAKGTILSVGGSGTLNDAEVYIGLIAFG